MILLTEGVVRLVASAAVFTVLAFWAKGEGLVLVSTAIFCGYFVALLISTSSSSLGMRYIKRMNLNK